MAITMTSRWHQGNQTKTPNPNPLPAKMADSAKPRNRAQPDLSDDLWVISQTCPPESLLGMVLRKGFSGLFSSLLVCLRVAYLAGFRNHWRGLATNRHDFL